MSKPNLEQMNKELHPEKSYRGLVEIEKALKELGNLNSNYSMSKEVLVKKLSVIFYEDETKTYSKESNFSEHFGWLKNFVDSKLDLINQMRDQLDKMEQEARIQEELIGGYHHQFKQLNRASD